jgi:hypothetical protein
VRLYLPATLPRLARWLDAGEAQLDADGPGELAFGVTPTLREWYHDADHDELEHAAQLAAAMVALELIAADPDAARRRLVIAADIDDALVSPAPDRGRAAVTTTVRIPRKRWRSALVDDVDAASVVGAAVTNLAAARSGDDDAQFTLDEAEAYELGWYAVQELRYLLD